MKFQVNSRAKKLSIAVVTGIFLSVFSSSLAMANPSRIIIGPGRYGCHKAGSNGLG